MRKRLFILLMLVLFIGFASLTQGQAPPDTCPAFVEQALSVVSDNCAGLDRNTACYGYNQIAASFVVEVEEDVFSQPADRVELTELRTIQTSPLDLDRDLWGVAVLNVQANVPNTLPGQAVTFILLGDASLENGVTPEEAALPVDPVAVVVNASDQRVNLRSGPSTNTNVVDTAGGGDVLEAEGQNEAGDWLRATGEEGGTFWIARILVSAADGDETALDTLPIVGEENRSPMQAFYFSTGLGVSNCFEAPNMLLIQTPQEVSEINLTVNGVEINVGSTIVLISEQAEFGTFTAFGVMEGQLDEMDVNPDTLCNHTSMIVMDGEIDLNDGSDQLPIGHFAENVTCFPEGRNGTTRQTEWSNVRRLSQEEMGLFAIVENIPESLLRYPVEIPSDDEIDGALEATRPTAVPTRVPSNNNQPQPTTPPNQPQPTATPPPGQVDCSAFRATSPPDGGPVPFGPQTFYWDPIANVDAYQIDIKAFYDSGQFAGGRLIRVGSNITNVTADLSSGEFGEGISIAWFVQALVGTDGNFRTVCETPVRSNPINFN